MIRILFLAANPTDQLRLQSRREFDQLRHALDAAPYGRRFNLIQEFAVAADQLQELLVRHQPQVVHFSGHGAEEGLLFEATDGRSQRVAPQTLRDLFASFRQTVRCVVLNACYSNHHTDAIATVTDSVVGMSDALTDDAALAFATAFYRALANGATLADAVALGRNQLDLQGLDEAHKPQLLADRIDVEQVRALDWDDTPPADNRESVLFIPFLRKSATEFVGRDAELVELHEKLQQSQMVGVRPAAALTGLGGIGKTQLAVEYAYRYQASYPGGIYWINAADLNRVRSQLVETAERMGLRTDYNTTDNALLAGLVKRCQQQPATLLCFDNAPDAVILWRRLTQELNTATLGAAILITTRRRDLPPNMAALDLRRLSDNTVRQLLATARLDLLTHPDLPRLLERLGGLPLVVSLVANALQNSPDATIADYLAALTEHGEETVHEELDVHVTDYDLYREVYTRTLLPVLREQWERLCQQPKSENAQLLLRIAGQLPEAAEIPVARLGLLAGLQDEKVIKPLASAVNTLWKLALVEELQADTIRLHPLVRNFAATLTAADERNDFRTACVQRLADAYTLEESGLRRLGNEYAARGIAALLLDLVTALDLCQSSNPQSPVSSSQSLVSSLQSLLRLLRLEANHLQGSSTNWQPERLWQQLLLCIPLTTSYSLTPALTRLLQQTLHWLPVWAHQRQSPALEQTLSGHEGWVWGVAVLGTQRIVSASEDCTLKVWNLQTGEVEQTLRAHETGVRDVVVLDTQRIASVSYDRILKVWNLQSGEVEQTLREHENRTNAVAVADTLQYGTRLSENSSRKVDQVLRGHEDEAGVRGVAVLDSQRILSPSHDHTLKVWNLQTGEVEQTFHGHKDKVLGVAALDSQRIVSASYDGTLNVWNRQTGEIEQTFNGHKHGVNSVVVLDSAKGTAQRIVSASYDGMLKVWNLQTGKMEQTFSEHKSWVLGVAVLASVRGTVQRIVSASTNRTLKIWNLQTREVEQTLTGHEDWINGVAVLDAQRIVSTSHDRVVKVWNLQMGGVDQALRGHVVWVRSVAVLDDQRIISASSDRTLKVWNLQTGEVEQTLHGHESGVWSVAVLDTQRIVSASQDNTLKVWNLQTGEVEQTLRGHELGIRSVAVLDTYRIVSASDDGTLKVWNLQTGEMEQMLRGHEAAVRCVAVLDDQFIVSASSDGTLKVWNLQIGELEQSLNGHKSWVNSVAVLDDQSIVSASYDRTIKIWNRQTGRVEQTLRGHEAEVLSVTALDTQYIVSASWDRTIKTWNLQTGQVVASIGLDGSLHCITVTRQGGRTLVVAGDRGGALYCLELVEPKS